MKIGAIKRVITQGKKIVIYEDGGQQWIGTEDACYLLDGVRVDKNSVGSLLDMSENKMEEMAVSVQNLENSGLLPCRAFECQEVQELLPVVLGRPCIPIQVAEELYVIDAQKIKAAKVGKDDPFLRMGRNQKGDPLILVSDRCRVNGIVRPENTYTVENVLDWVRRMMSLKIGTVYQGGAAQITIREVMQGDDEDDAD